MRRANEVPVARIYCIRNKVNGFVYIGATKKSIEDRFHAHMKPRLTRRYKKENSFIRDIEKFGRENFSIELVENIYDPNIIAEIENYWIEKFNKSKMYNVAKSSYTVDAFNKVRFDSYRHNAGKGE